MALLSQEDSVLMVIDMQGNLYESMQDKSFLLENVRKLVRGMQVFGIPVIVTEQIPEKLGPTIEPVVSLLPDAPRIPKSDFSCCGEEKIMKALKALERQQVLLCGIETHVCVYQTAVDLLGFGYDVHLVADAVSSRTVLNREIGIRKLRDEGARLASTEMVLFELIRTADDPKFKEIFRIVK
ncbi:MAG: hydrolase [Pseudomonadota bacterium]|jgi:nicotinamidase-related amidase|nr:hydrolase [Pseudomonadota bacterium]HOT48625.1 hydrolase [Syntrophales bacterium]HPK19533.1 hydrolase [Syntrophales bacterium]HPV54776.1 hydrolase [Syntrophales bacterium]HPX02879.1 hydrolase [Syntrophales bacterium]